MTDIRMYMCGWNEQVIRHGQRVDVQRPMMLIAKAYLMSLQSVGCDCFRDTSGLYISPHCEYWQLRARTKSNNGGFAIILEIFRDKFFRQCVVKKWISTLRKYNSRHLEYCFQWKIILPIASHKKVKIPDVKMPPGHVEDNVAAHWIQRSCTCASWEDTYNSEKRCKPKHNLP